MNAVPTDISVFLKRFLIVLWAVMCVVSLFANTSFATPVPGDEHAEADDGCEEDCPCDEDGEEDCEEDCEDCSCGPAAAASPAALSTVSNIAEQLAISELMPSITGAQRDGPPLSLFKPPRHLSV